MRRAMNEMGIQTRIITIYEFEKKTFDIVAKGIAERKDENPSAKENTYLNTYLDCASGPNAVDPMTDRLLNPQNRT